MKTDTDTSFKFTVLVVEDDDKFRMQLAQYLRGEGFQIVEANSSSEACAFIRKRKPSLVVLDWDLHKANSSPEHPSTGLKVLQTCHEVDALLPVVVISGEPLLDARGDSMMAGADCFLQKPFALALLSEHLRRWMGAMNGRPACRKGLEVPFALPDLGDDSDAAKEFAKAATTLLQK